MIEKQLQSIPNHIIVLISFVILIISLAVGIRLETKHQNQIFNSQKQFARYINIAGKQRMLSQRIALIILKQKDQSNPNYSEVKELVDEFQSNHKFLVTGLVQDTLMSYYYKEPINLDHRVRTFISDIRNYLNVEDNSLLGNKIIKDSNEILNYLHLATELFQTSSEDISYSIIDENRWLVIKLYLLLFSMFLIVIIPASLRIRKNDRALHIKTKALKRSLKKLAENEHLLKLALEKNSLAYWIIDHVNNTKYFSSVGYDILGIDKGKEISMMDWDNIIHPEDKNKIIEDHRSLLTREKDQYEHIHRIKNKDGAYIWIKVYAAALIQDNKVNKVIGIFSDINEEIKLKQQLIEAKESAITANRSKSEFLSNMSHEIRTPMNSIFGYVSILTKLISDETQRKYLTYINTNSKLLLSLIDDILDLAKIEAGKMELDTGYVSIRNLVEEMKTIFNYKLRTKNLEFKIDVDDNVPIHVVADELRLQQALTNLISNAIKFTHEGYVKLKVKAKPLNGSTYSIQIVVSDSGIGIDKKNRKKIFDSFHQVDGQDIRKYGGTGLGLTITKNLIELMGGKLSVESELGKGSDFMIDFPSITCSNNAVIKVSQSNKIFENVDFKGSRVLVVDDIKDNRQLLKDMLEVRHLQIVTCSNGKKALQKLKEKDIDLIITDIQMPEMSGLELARDINQLKKYAGVPIFAYTASAIKNKYSKEELSIFSAFITKPIKEEVLINELIKYLPHAPLNRETNSQLITNEPLIKYELSSEKEKQLLAELEQIQQEHEKLKERQAMDDIKSFALRNISVGEDFNIDQFVIFGNGLLNAYEVFDIEYIINNLLVFTELINNVLKELKKS
ncbi:ATP-binding protein [Plebeiibacterium sediminum]|uniref:Sensory/regulatory protein RpfC n=1 Tax=Plebeiibacterium sediminum TaxID=2992112 RepID=A0AAE3M3A2_9BACT|nr:ATP-binding protein [Plebeiobacterium sediminum]MCW3786304.1 ATP-binding protein [Plebeiobacterium sediminum]